MSTMPDPVPIHTYETTEGTKPVRYGRHEPRTLAHTVTAGDKADLVSMMTEIGDGTFVAWTECRKCSKHIAHCTCANGPTEPHYMKPWRDKRFKQALDERPDPSYEILDSVVDWLRERGYTVTKDEVVAPAVDEDGYPGDPGFYVGDDQEPMRLNDDGPDYDGHQPDDRKPLERPSTAFERPPGNAYQVPGDEDLYPSERKALAEHDAAMAEPDTAEQVDAGLDDALEKVREAKARDISDIDVDF